MRALEAIRDGDAVFAEAILEDLVKECEPPSGVTCPDCGHSFQWPGLRDAHMCGRRWSASLDEGDEQDARAEIEELIERASATPWQDAIDADRDPAGISR